jgi:uncharacterized protein (TIRG00374 family)
MTRRVLYGVVFGIAVYAGITIWVGFDEFREALSDFDWRLVPVAMGLSLANYLIRFWKWERYRNLLSIGVDRRTSFLVYMAGFSMGITPGKMGEVLKSWLLKKVDGTRIHHSAPIVVAERVTDLLGYLLLVAIGGLATMPDYQWIFWIVLLACGVGIALVGSTRISQVVTFAISRTPYLWRLASRVEGSFASTRVLLSPREIVMPTATSVLSWGCECVGFWLIADGLTDGDLPFLFAVFAYAFSAVAGAVLLLFPGGIGPTEGFLGALLRRKIVEVDGLSLDLARGHAGAAVLVTRVCTLWFGVGVGMLALALFRHRFGRIEEETMDRDEGS